MYEWMATRSADGWTEQVRLPAPVDIDGARDIQADLLVDPTLYFTSHRDGSADVWRVPVSALGIRAR
jgi:hypothetical protein